MRQADGKGEGGGSLAPGAPQLSLRCSYPTNAKDFFL